ncbi:hypothetical protein [Leucobacter sp. cx-169]|uniref:hypothetical protein n=1 Tax=Leucobacter sp. cx-169 TaxID=2770549 RepID=UPI00165D7B3F|nr:hypothetical protein [Leucobacter sp. cx-169]MBC9927271.1 hypothetical protein [Leucobacter sp. cx-169]
MSTSTSTETTSTIELLPDLEGYVHGIVNLDPPTVQCDGCGKTHTEATLNLAIITSRILFLPRRYAEDQRRMCDSCWDAAGYPRELRKA